MHAYIHTYIHTCVYAYMHIDLTALKTREAEETCGAGPEVAAPSCATGEACRHAAAVPANSWTGGVQANRIQGSAGLNCKPSPRSAAQLL